MCEWKDKDEQIICALIFGAGYRDAQKKALSKPKDIKLKDVIDHFASFKATDAYHKLLSANNSSGTTVNRVQRTHHKHKPSSSTNSINCYSCGVYANPVVVGTTMNQRVILRAINQSQILNKNNQNHTNLIIEHMVAN